MILVLIQLQKMELSLPLLSKMQEMFFHFADFVTLNLVRYLTVRKITRFSNILFFLFLLTVI